MTNYTRGYRDRDDHPDGDEDYEDARAAAGTPFSARASAEIPAPHVEPPPPPREMTPEEREEIELLVSILPERVAEPLRARGFDGLIEVIVDLGRRPTAR